MFFQEHHLMQAILLKRANHRVRVSHQLDIQGILEIALSFSERIQVHRIGWRFVHKYPITDPILQHLVKLLRRVSLALVDFDNLLRFFGVAALSLHNGPDRPLCPQTESPRESRASFR